MKLQTNELKNVVVAVILLAGHPIGRLTDFVSVNTKNSRAMTRPNSSDMPPKRTKMVRLIILYIIRYYARKIAAVKLPTALSCKMKSARSSNINSNISWLFLIKQ